MSPGSVVQIVREMFMTALWVSAPLLLIGFTAAIVMSLIQIVTSIQDSAFSAIPRLIVFLGALLLLMPWMLSRMMTYAIGIFGDLGRYAR
ncbi:flagellar biosynthetic protein FliQ [Nevskia soli]|jgi:flagellar biosynthetic protein FliQ|uniref:flagellar biosynthetic protein FliQ n=1 Tax=Nevskia soli TaxID=418856 RepID=UPI0015D76FD9|nr:flagellar biosynthetic protein FliQ [Nevskia soli]